MQTSGSTSNNSSLRLTSQQSLRRLGLCSQIANRQQTSPVVFPEKRNRGKTAKGGSIGNKNEDPKNAKRGERRIDIGDEESDLLGYEVFAGKLASDKKKYNTNAEAQTSKENASLDAFDAKLTSKAFVWGTEMLSLEDVISVDFFRFIVNFMTFASSFYFYFFLVSTSIYFPLAVITLCWTETFYSACISMSKRLMWHFNETWEKSQRLSLRSFYL